MKTLLLLGGLLLGWVAAGLSCAKGQTIQLPYSYGGLHYASGCPVLRGTCGRVGCRRRAIKQRRHAWLSQRGSN